MQVLIFTLLFCCCEVFGRPSDPVIREFGTQPNNPNVKIFSTYPTLKPPVIKDNPNDLEKGPDQEKYEKDEREVAEEKGDEITKIQSNLTDTNLLDELETVTEENFLEPNFSAGDLLNDESSDVLTTSENEMEMKNTEDMSTGPTEDGRTTNETTADNKQETKYSDINPQVEIDADQNPEVGIAPGMEEVVAPIAEYDLMGPLVIDAPVTIIPSIAEELGEIPEEEILFTIPDMDLNEDEIYELNAGNPFLNTGVMLPELVPMKEVADAGNEGLILPLKVESTTLSPIIGKDLESNIDAKKEFPREVPESNQPVAEITGEIFEPMASLSEESVLLDPISEGEEEPINSESQGDANEPLVPTEDLVKDNTPMEEGDVGVSVPLIEEIPPIVEVESELPAEVTEEEISSGVEVKDSEGDNIKNSTNETIDQSIQMAGFMSDASKSFLESEKKEEGSLPLATDLSLALNISHDEISPTPSNETQIQTQVEPMDQLDMLDNQQPTSEVDSIPSSTTLESVPTLDPMELTADEGVNEDPTLNEAI